MKQDKFNDISTNYPRLEKQTNKNNPQLKELHTHAIPRWNIGNLQIQHGQKKDCNSFVWAGPE